MKKQVPKYVLKLLNMRRDLADKLLCVCNAVDKYCEKIGLDTTNPLFEDACLASDVRIYCEPEAARCGTIECIEKVLLQKE